ncbi:hypothetical protein Vretifemale_7734 [Volvox reticuliferus]|nr:hypothetical protein Vretifemale_7734 [Volvox reticuliferus]
MPYLQNHAFVVQSPPAFSSYHPAPSSSRQPPQYKYRDVTHNTSVLTHGSFCGTATVQCSSRHRAAAADCHGSWDQPEGAATGLKSLAAIVDVDVGERTSAAASAAVSAVTSLELGGASSPRLISAAPEVEKVPSIEGEQMVKGGDDPDAAASIVAASRDSCGISISSTCSSNVNLSKSSSDGQQRLTSTDLHTFLAKQGIRAEVVSEVTPGSLPAGQGIVKSIVMMEVAEGRSERPQLVPLLVVVRLEDRVDERRVAELLKVPRRRLRLARADEVLTHTGFAVGTVPPFGE